MIVIKNAEVFSPAPLGKKDILMGGGKILALEDRMDPSTIPGVRNVLDVAGALCVPGFIDGHQHFTGGGGEGGFHTRVPEMTVSMNFRNGVTTAIGLLGTDSYTRSLENLYAKTQAFNAEGLTAFMLTGAYRYPSLTLTGTVARDIVFLQPVIGLKLALSDFRGPHLEARDLASLASEVQVAGLVAHKPGIITLHMGALSAGLDLVFEITEGFEIRPSIFVPTHVNRKSDKLNTQALTFAERGGVIDATCHAEVSHPSTSWTNAADFACLARDQGLLGQITFSSDAGGSLPLWNKDRSQMIGMGVGTPASLLFELNLLVNRKGLPLDQALLPLTATPARIYGLQHRKGRIETGKDADVVILDPGDFSIRHVIAGGEMVVQNGEVVKKGYLESVDSL